MVLFISRPLKIFGWTKPHFSCIKIFTTIDFSRLVVHKSPREWYVQCSYVKLYLLITVDMYSLKITTVLFQTQFIFYYRKGSLLISFFIKFIHYFLHSLCTPKNFQLVFCSSYCCVKNRMRYFLSITRRNY